MSTPDICAGWDTLPHLIELEFQQCAEEGRDSAGLAALRARWEAGLPRDRATLEALHAELLALPMQAAFPFEEPSDLAGIQRLRPGSGPALNPVDTARLADQMLGAWLGRCVGCALGKPVESMMRGAPQMNSYEMQKRYLQAISPEEWPVRDYIPAHSPAEAEPGMRPLVCPASQRENIAFMETDDDIRYTVLGQVILTEYGADFTTVDVARAWTTYLPYRLMCTAETQAYRNLVYISGMHLGSFAPDWEWVAHHLNPYREWIGAQIRVDSYGYAAPGNPALAAEMAWRDARLSHVKNGIYGAMFCAAMIAAAFVTSDVEEIIEAGLAQIPATSRLYRDIRAVIGICQAHGCSAERFEEVFVELHALLGHLDAVHTNNNAGLCVAALLLSGGDFHQGITLAVMGGWDTDCNGATVGSIVGAITGGAAAPEHWTGRLNDTLNSAIAGYHPISIAECARRSTSIAEKILGH